MTVKLPARAHAKISTATRKQNATKLFVQQNGDFEKGPEHGRSRSHSVESFIDGGPTEPRPQGAVGYERDRDLEATAPSGRGSAAPPAGAGSNRIRPPLPVIPWTRRLALPRLRMRSPYRAHRIRRGITRGQPRVPVGAGHARPATPEPLRHEFDGCYVTDSGAGNGSGRARRAFRRVKSPLNLSR